MIQVEEEWGTSTLNFSELSSFKGEGGHDMINHHVPVFYSIECSTRPTMSNLCPLNIYYYICIYYECRNIARKRLLVISLV